MSLKGLLRQFILSSRGANLIEFAFIAPIFLTMIIGVMDVGGMLIVQNALDAGAREAARFGLTGATVDGLSRDEAIREKVLDTVVLQSGGIVPRDEIIINVSAYDNIEGIDTPEPFEDTNMNGMYDVGELYIDTNGNSQWDPDRGAAGSFGAAGEAVKYEITYNWTSFLGMLGFKPNMLLIGEATVRNEDFNDK